MDEQVAKLLSIIDEGKVAPPQICLGIVQTSEPNLTIKLKDIVLQPEQLWVNERLLKDCEFEFEIVGIEEREAGSDIEITRGKGKMTVVCKCGETVSEIKEFKFKGKALSKGTIIKTSTLQPDDIVLCIAIEDKFVVVCKVTEL